MADAPGQAKEAVTMNASNHNDSVFHNNPDSSSLDDDPDQQALAKNLPSAKVKNMDGPKKKSSSFQITRVITKSGLLDVTNEDADSLDDLDETNTEDLSSDFQELSNISRTIDLAEPSMIDDNLAHPNAQRDDLMLNLKDSTDVSNISSNIKPVVLHPPSQGEPLRDKGGDTQSRFKVVKIESKDPFKRGRWVCLDFLDPPTSDRGGEKQDKGGDDLGGSGNSSASSSVHYVPGIDDPAKNPLAANMPYPNGPQIVESLASHAASLDSDLVVGVDASVVLPGQGVASGIPSSVGGIPSMPAGSVPVTTTTIPSSVQRSDSGALPHIHSSQAVAPSPIPADPSSIISSTPQPPADIAASQAYIDHVSATPAPGTVSQSMLVTSLSQTQLPTVPATDVVTATSVSQPSYPISDSQLGLAISQAMLSGQEYAGLTVTSGQPHTAPPVSITTTADDIRASDFVASEATYVTASEDKPLSGSLRMDRLSGSERLKLSDSILRPPLLEMVSASMQPFTGSVKEDESGASTVAIDNKIEQAMDLVKSHLMFAVREEVEVLKEQIKELLEKNSQLECENSLLKAAASPETLTSLKQQQQLQQQQQQLQQQQLQAGGGQTSAGAGPQPST